MAEERHPRGLVVCEVLGKRRKLRATLSFPANYRARTGQPFLEFCKELDAGQEDPFSIDPEHLLAAVAELTAGGGEEISEEELGDSVLGDFVGVGQAIVLAMVESGLMETIENGKKKPPATKKKRHKKKGNDRHEIPWEEWQQIAFTRLHLTPQEFYDMSFREWRAALDGLRAQGGKARISYPRVEDFDHLRHRMGSSRSIVQ